MPVKRRQVLLMVALITALPSSPLAAQNEPSPDEPAQIRSALRSIGFPPPLADYFAAVQITVLGTDERSFHYRETYPDGVTRTVAYELEPDSRYEPSPAELADMSAAGVQVLGADVVRMEAATDAQTDEVRFFVPYDGMSPDLRERFRPVAGLDWPAWFGIRTAVAQDAGTGGLGVIQRATIGKASVQAFSQAMEMLGSVTEPMGPALSGVVDAIGAIELHNETRAYLQRLDELERCARNPEHSVPVPEAERQQMLDTVGRIRSELKRVTSIRFLNMLADAPLSATRASGGPVAGAVGSVLSVVLKPVSTWSDQALQSYIRDTLMREAEAAVPCRQSCNSLPSAVPQTVSSGTAAAVTQPAVRGCPLRPDGSCSGGAKAPAPSASSTVTPPRQPSAAPVRTPPAECDRDPNRVFVRLVQVERYDEPTGAAYLHRQASVRASAVVTPLVPGRLSRGQGVGTFRETAELGWPNNCVRRILTAADTTLTVEYQHENREALATFRSDQVYPSDRTYETYPDNPHCGGYTGTQGGPGLEISCAFFDVDLERGGVYQADGDYDHYDDDEHRMVSCELRVGPPEPEDEDEPPSQPPDSGSAGVPIANPTGSSRPATPGPADGPPGTASSTPTPRAIRNPGGAGRYRVMLMGARAITTTNDNPSSVDGLGDEVYAVAALLEWDRLEEKAIGFKLERTREYGETAGAGASPQRIRAGSAGPSGGILPGDTAPDGYDPDASPPPGSATHDRFPLLLWEGALTAGRNVLLIAPSLWERDTSARVFDAYRLGWLTAPVARLLSEPVIMAALATPTLEVVVAPPYLAADAGMPATGTAGRYVLIPGLSAADASRSGDDRPIGIDAWAGTAAVYRERYLVVSPEKLAVLPMGGETVRVPLADTAHPALGGSYELFVRIERVQ